MDFMDIQRARIDEDVQRHRLAICNLHAERNALAPVSRLPSELLAYIFILLTRDRFLTDGTDPVCHAPAWSQVSTHWRNVALNCTTVWSYIFTASRRWTKDLLKRSGQTPLKIRVERGAQLDFWSTRATELVDRVDRIEEFLLSTNRWDVAVHEVFPMLFPTIPHLKVLQLSMELMEPNVLVSDKGVMPAILWYLSKLRNLTSLVLASIPLSNRYDIRDLRATLIRMPNLKHLCLENALASTYDFMEFDSLQKIDMPCLVRLRMTAPASTVFAFLSSVKTPGYMQAKLQCQREYNPSLDFDHNHLWHVLARHYSINRLPILPTIHLVAMSIQEDEAAVALCTSLECNHKPPSNYSYPECFEWDRNVFLEIAFRSTSVLSMWNALYICTSIPIANNAQTLHVFYPPSCQTFWKKLLEHFSGLRRMKLIDGDMPYGLISVLRPQASGRPTKDWQILVPQLDELELVAIDFETSTESDADVESDAGSDAGSDTGSEGSECSLTTTQSLYDALSSRTGQGRLTMTRCGVDGPYDIAGRWKGGRFHVIDQRRHYHTFEVELEDSDKVDYSD